LSVRQDAVTVHVGADCRVDDVFTQFAEYRCQRDWSVVNR